MGTRLPVAMAAIAHSYWRACAHDQGWESGEGEENPWFSLKNKKPSYSAHLQTEEHGEVEVGDGARLCRQKAGDWQRVSPGGQLAQAPCHFPEWASDREAVWASSGILWDFRK